PAQDVLFSVVEEERGPGLFPEVRGSGAGCTPEQTPASFPLTPDFSYFQLRAHMYQARGVLAADDSGLSDPFARVLISTQCQTTRVLEQTLSPLWDELLVFDQLIVDGRREHLQEEPPLVVINVFDHNKFGPAVFLGRALAAPRVKLVEDPYQRPELQFFPLRKGPRAAGELIATFELIELDYSRRLEVRHPPTPGVRPVLREFRVEVLFWGLRGLGRVHLFEVEQPQVVLEVAGRRVESEVLASYRESPNFTELVKHLTVDLPEQPYLQPPLSILVIERRAFGRTVLVGSHIVPHMLRFTLQGPEDAPEEEGEEEDPGDLVLSTPEESCRHPEGNWVLGVGLLEPARVAVTEAPALQIYNRCLEEEFDHFEDWLNVFPLYRGQGGQGDGDAEEGGSERFVGKFKGSFLIYPEAQAVSSEPKISRGIPQNRPLKLLVRVYVVKATNLAPADPNGKADPYVVVSAGQERQDTKERYIPKQLNPIFGDISLPAEPELTVAVFDHDLVGSDDLIGETHIDVENRFYSHHRANCGLASQYDVEGYNAWRDAFRPAQILAGLCQRCGLPAPEYRAGAVKVGSKVFLTPPETLPQGGGPSSALEEAQALLVLRRWQEMPELGLPLVPEHVETRPLYHPRSPGLLQGSLHMWVDIFPRDVPAPPPVDIKPRQPISYELRVVIWNTEDVVLDDVNPLTGEMSSDIYVKSWVKGLEHDKQETDVHFNSLTGEGNFNWRFVFRFNYLPTEREVSVRRRPGPFALEEAEFRQPALLVLQVWDYDRISANDFLGSLELQLPDMVRGARDAEHCSVRLARDGAVPRCNLFRCRRLRGWWPVVKLREAEDGKVEAEFELLTVEEAEKRPVGKGRKEPEPLEKPNRPKTSFNWFVNPLKTFAFFIWRRYWRVLVLLLLLALVTVFLLLVFYTMPGQISQAIFSPLHRASDAN
uniref:C2 domain-containing protein n=1 Tax=Oryctolagus cuniculus TaxID=9986 RepID=A0A5F9CH26_RABIT